MSAIILVIGATGVFGSRLVERLALTSTATILVASRSAENIAALIEQLSTRPLLATLKACVLDRERLTANDLRALGAHVVVDAAGPFQGQSLRLPEVAIEARCHFIDLADARDYVARFPQLDAAARRAGVLAVCGASSTPSLSHAALEQLLTELHRPEEVSVYISPGNRAPRGVAVVKAILSYVGRPVLVQEHGTMRPRAGWSLLHRRVLRGLASRWFSLCETPDLDLIPARFSSVRTARFYAGLELSVLHCGLWLLSWFVRLRVVRSLQRWAVPLHWLASLLERFGTDRGGMLVEASGRNASGAQVTARWGLVAEAGDGPYIPTLPALALIRKLIDRRESAIGAQACVGLLSLDDIVREFDGLRIQTYRDVLVRPAVFQRVIGESFSVLPGAVRALHTVIEAKTFTGVAQVERAANLCGALIARVLGFPAASADCAVTLTIELDRDHEVWRRQFASSAFRSRLGASSEAGMLIEQFGPIAIKLKLCVDRDGLSMTVVGWTLGPLPMPRALAPWTVARERVDECGRFVFDVEIGLPILGRLVRYRGWLEEHRIKNLHTASAT